MCKTTICTFGVVLLTVEAIGCKGGGNPSYPTTAAAGNAGYYAAQAGQQPNQPVMSPAFGAAVQPQQTRFGAVANAVTNNSATAAVGRAFSGVKMPNLGAAPMSSSDTLSLANQTKSPTPSLYTSMGKLAERAGNIDQARLHYQKALESSPTDVEALLAYGRLEDRQGRLDDALKIYDQAVRSNPNHASAHNDLGLCLARKGDFPAAAASLSQAVKAQPHRKLFRNNLATVLVELNRNDEALQQLTAVNPPAVAHYNMGVLLQKQGSTNDAVEQFAAAVKLDPTMQPASSWLAKLQGVAATSVAVVQSDVPQSTVPQSTVTTPESTVTTPTVTATQSPVVTVTTPPSQELGVVMIQNQAAAQPIAVVPQHQAVAPVVPLPQFQPNAEVTPPTQTQTLPVAPPIPQYAPNYPTFPQQASPMRYDPQGASAQATPGTYRQTTWPIHQPSQVPSSPLSSPGAQPPVPSSTTGVYTNARLQPLPPVQQASTAPNYARQ